jgi:UPF0716 family protein affecting phage T7 exclusion
VIVLTFPAKEIYGDRPMTPLRTTLAMLLVVAAVVLATPGIATTIMNNDHQLIKS